ncbi:MAG TPA: VOC family protein [Candidatus Tectomicrobia bacterium]|nr:VOC family protein [Candidatus Tectomicrobia bacterium]
MLSVPGFHHLHLNSLDPEAAIAFYTKQFPSTAKTSWGGLSALQSPNNVLILFTKVDTAPATSPQTAIWHFGWHVPDTRARLEVYKGRQEVKLLPLYTGDDGGTVFVSSDTWPGTGGVLGLTRAQIADAKASGVQPTRTGGFGYLQGPDNALVEYAGNHPTERFNHVHLFQEHPFCAQLWYQKQLSAPVFAGRSSSTPLSEATCRVERGPERTFPALNPEGMCRTPSAAVVFGDVALLWYMRQGDEPLVSSRGHVYDHMALSVTDLDAWIAKLRGEGVRFLTEPYQLGDTRAVMIEGPSREALELVEIHRPQRRVHEPIPIRDRVS